MCHYEILAIGNVLFVICKLSKNETNYVRSIVATSFMYETLGFACPNGGLMVIYHGTGTT